MSVTLNEAATILERVGARGFDSKPVPCWISKDTMAQYVTFTSEEQRKLRMFLGANPHLARTGRHPIGPFFGNPARQSFTVSLLGRIAYAIDGKHISPEYVFALAAELRDSESIYKDLYEVAALSKLL